MTQRIKSLGTAAIIAASFWFILGGLTLEGAFGAFFGSPPLVLLAYGLIGGPILGVAGGILLVISERRPTAGEWVALAFIASGLGWGLVILLYLGWISSLEVTIAGLVLSLVLIAVGVGALAWERRSIQAAGVA